MGQANQKGTKAEREIAAQQRAFEAKKNEQEAQHNAYVNFLKETTLNRMCLIGIQQQGISSTFVTDIQGEMTGAIAVCLSSDKTVGRRGMYFDMRQLTFYKIYSPEEQAEIEKEWEDSKKLVAMPTLADKAPLRDAPFPPAPVEN